MKERDAIREALKDARIRQFLQKGIDAGQITAHQEIDRSRAVRFVLTRLADIAEFGLPTIDDAIMLRCELCREPCSVAPETQKMLEGRRGPTELVCTRCFVKEQQAAPTRIS